MTQWAYQDEIVPEEIIPENKRLNVLAENDEFVVVVPPPEATARIRVLEREFALDHADCLRGHSMHLAMAPDEWCGFAGIPVNEAISVVLTKKNWVYFSDAVLSYLGFLDFIYRFYRWSQIWWFS